MKPAIDWKDALREVTNTVELDEEVIYFNEKYSYIDEDYIAELKAQYEEREAFRKRYEADNELNAELEMIGDAAVINYNKSKIQGA